MPAIPMPAPDMPAPAGTPQTAPADPDAAGAALAAAEARIAALLAELSAAKSGAAAVPKTPDADDRRESLARLALRESAVSARESALAQREQDIAARTESETAAREAALAERVAALESENAALKQAPAAAPAVTVEPAKSDEPPAPAPARLEDVEAALLRQRLSDIAAEVAAMTAAVEGTGGAIDELLAKSETDLAAPAAPRASPRRSAACANAPPRRARRPDRGADGIRGGWNLRRIGPKADGT